MEDRGRKGMEGGWGNGGRRGDGGRVGEWGNGGGWREKGEVQMYMRGQGRGLEGVTEGGRE